MAVAKIKGPEAPPSGSSVALTSRPVSRASTLARAAIVDRLRGLTDARAVMLCAPAGYGKTTVLLQWSEADERAFAWVTVDDLDDDPAVFIRHLLAPLSAVEPVEPEVFNALSATEPHFSTTVLPLLARTIRERSVPFVLVLDDLGELSSARSLRVLGVVLSNLPAGCQVACASRTAPPPPVRRLRTEGALAELGRADLAMTTDEAFALVRSLGMDESTAAARRLVERAEGWAAGLYLATAAAVGGASSDPDSPPWGETAVEDAVADYLIDEFLARTDPVTVRFLLETSVLAELSGPVCDAVTQAQGSAALLHELSRSNELIVPIVGPREVYRYHRLFGEFLRAELRRRDPDRLVVLNRRACEWYRDAGHLDRAVRHARAAGDLALLGEIVWSEALHFLSAGRGDVVSSWIHGLEDRELARSCGLALTAAWIATQRGDMVAFTRWLATAEARLREEEPSSAARFGPGVAVVRALAGRDELPEIAELSAYAIATEAPDSPLLALAFCVSGVALVLLGREGAGVQDLERGEALARAHGMHSIQAQCLAALGRVMLASGHSTRGTARVMQAREIVTRHGLEHIPTLATVFAASALVLAMQGRAGQAEREALIALRQASLIRGFTPWFTVQGRLQLARTFLLLQDRERARVLVDEARALHGPATRSPVLDALLSETTELVRGAAVPDLGPSSLTTAELRVLQYLPSHLTFPQIAEELYVSPHTVKSQAAAVYRKLGATSRRAAVVTARAIGLLPAP